MPPDSGEHIGHMDMRRYAGSTSIKFYNAHHPSCVQGQYVDGLRAPFVIHPSAEVHSYDAEFTVVMSDWYHNEHSVLLKRFISVADPGGAEPIPGQPD
jgi:iron transport multicopper oxidase